MNISGDNFSQTSPAWVVKFVAGLTVFLQLAMPIILSTTALTPDTKGIIDLVSKIINAGIAAIAPFIGTSK